MFLLMSVLAAAVAVRAVFLGWTLFPATVVVGLCIANLNVLMPAFVKQRFPDHPGPLTSAYVASATLGPAIAAGLTVPVFHAFGGSVNWALGIWALPALAALAGWSPQLWVARRLKRRRTRRSARWRRPRPRRIAGRAAPPRPIWRHALAWQVMVYMGIGSLVFYGPLSWLSQIYQSRGLVAGHRRLPAPGDELRGHDRQHGRAPAHAPPPGRPAGGGGVRHRGDGGVRRAARGAQQHRLLLDGGARSGPGRPVRSGAAAHRHPGGRRSRGGAAIGDVAVRAATSWPDWDRC